MVLRAPDDHVRSTFPSSTHRCSPLTDQNDTSGVNAVDMLRIDFLSGTPRRSVRDLIAEKLAVLILFGVWTSATNCRASGNWRRRCRSAGRLSAARSPFLPPTASCASHMAHARSSPAVMCRRSCPRRPVSTLPPTSGCDLEDVHEARLLVERDIAFCAAEHVTPTRPLRTGSVHCRAGSLPRRSGLVSPVRPGISLPVLRCRWQCRD